MKKTKFLLTLMVYALAAEPVLQGRTSPTAQKSFSAKCGSIEKLLQSLQDQLLNRPLQGRKRLELMASIEEDAYEGGAKNEIMNQLKELISSIEDDAVMNTNGNLNVRAFRQHVRNFKTQLLALKQSFGAARKRTISRKTFKPIMNPPKTS
jgi:hypothetical protein